MISLFGTYIECVLIVTKYGQFSLREYLPFFVGYPPKFLLDYLAELTGFGAYYVK